MTVRKSRSSLCHRHVPITSARVAQKCSRTALKFNTCSFCCLQFLKNLSKFRIRQPTRPDRHSHSIELKSLLAYSNSLPTAYDRVTSAFEVNTIKRRVSYLSICDNAFLQVHHPCWWFFHIHLHILFRSRTNSRKYRKPNTRYTICGGRCAQLDTA